MVRGLSLFLVLVACVTPSLAEEPQWGHVRGQVVWAGEAVPEPKPLVVDKDKEFCLAKGPILSDELVVDPQSRGVRWVCVWLVDAKIAERAKPTSHTTRDIEGWTVRIDDRLLAGADKEVGDKALRILANRLYDIQMVVPVDRLEKLRKVTIQIDRTHGDLRPAQYHPSAGWLKNNGYSESLAKCVHIPDAADFASLGHQRVQPWSTLHELAHAYHDQILDFGHVEVKASYERFKAGGRYEKTLHIDGRETKHYALTNEKEFFAEMTEAYFGVNDFFPFNRAELKKEEPELYKLLEKIWSKK